MAPDLIADVGGTHARFALVRLGTALDATVMPTAGHPTLEAALRAYLVGRERPGAAIIAGAGPVDNGRILMTNCPWVIDAGALVAAFGLARCRLMNDFEALAHSLPHLAADQALAIGPVRAPQDGPRLVLGPGTGFGAALLVPHGDGAVVVPTEGGHLLLAVGDVEGADILGPAERFHGRLSNEAILSGDGILRIYRAACRTAGEAAIATSAASVAELAASGDGLADRALDLFCALLGAAAGDLALATGARGGVYIAGGIAPRMRQRLERGAFRARFEAKAPMGDYVRAIPTFLVTAPYPALIGLAALAGRPA